METYQGRDSVTMNILQTVIMAYHYQAVLSTEILLMLISQFIFIFVSALFERNCGTLVITQ